MKGLFDLVKKNLVVSLTLLLVLSYQCLKAQSLNTSKSGYNNFVNYDRSITTSLDYPKNKIYSDAKNTSSTADIRLLLNYYFGGEIFAGAFTRVEFESYFQHVGYYNTSTNLEDWLNYDVIITCFGQISLTTNEVESIKNFLLSGGGMLIGTTGYNECLNELKKIDPALTFDNNIHPFGQGFILPYDKYSGLAIGGVFKQPLFGEFLTAIDAVGSNRIGNRLNQVKTYYGEDAIIINTEVELTCDKSRVGLYETLDLPQILTFLHNQEQFTSIDIPRVIKYVIKPVAIEFGSFVNGITNAYDRIVSCQIPGNCSGIFAHEAAHIFEREFDLKYFTLPGLGVGVFQEAAYDTYNFGNVINEDGKISEKRVLYLWYAFIDLIGKQNLITLYNSLNSHYKTFVPTMNYWMEISTYPEEGTSAFLQSINVTNYYMSTAYSTNYTQKIRDWGYTEIQDWQPIKEIVTSTENIFQSFVSPTSVQSEQRAEMWNIFYKGLYDSVPFYTNKITSLTPAINPKPTSGSIDQPVNMTLSWTHGGSATMYDIYIGTSQTLGPNELFKTQSDTSLNLSSLNYSTVYYWRVDTRNSTGISQGSVWNFTTMQEPNHPPNKPKLLTPANGLSVGVPFIFSWTCTDPDGDDLKYGFELRVKGTTDWESNGYQSTQALEVENIDNNFYNIPIEWRVIASDGIDLSISDIFEFTITSTTSIRNTEEANRVYIYPNPANEILTVELNNPEAKDFELEICTYYGNLIYRDSFKSLLHDNIFKIDISHFNRGAYFVKIITNNNVFYKKLIVN